jgi:hypothetical protein
MGKVKELLEVADYAEECCGFSNSIKEARENFTAIYPEPEYHEIFEEALCNWIDFSEYILEL